jgi:hypothetical protein
MKVDYIITFKNAKKAEEVGIYSRVEQDRGYSYSKATNNEADGG